jgi:methionyl aminopeptidase
LSIDSKRDLDGLLAVGRIVRAALQAMERLVRPGVTTAEINRAGAEVLSRNGARSAPMMVYRFPSETCISINEEIVHGIPSSRIVADGDLVKLDVTAAKDGYMADAAITVPAGSTRGPLLELADCAARAFVEALRMARAANPVHAIGRAVEREVTSSGFAVIRELSGHGIGRTIHEPPVVPNYFDPQADALLTPGLVITIEPMVTSGSGRALQGPDGWTLVTADGAAASHHEETIVITDRDPIVLTAAA